MTRPRPPTESKPRIPSTISPILEETQQTKRKKKNSVPDQTIYKQLWTIRSTADKLKPLETQKTYKFKRLSNSISLNGATGSGQDATI